MKFLLPAGGCMFTGTNVRIFLWAVLAMALYLNYTAWRIDYPPAPPMAQAPAGQNLDNSAPRLEAPGTAPPAVAAATVATVPSADAAASESAAAGTVRVITDVFDMKVSLLGGELQQVDLVRYPVKKGQPELVRLFNRDNPASLYVLQSGLVGANAGSAPTHLATFKSAVSEVKLPAGQDTVSLPLTWTSGDGVTVTKTYTFHRGEYRIGLEYKIDNASANSWQFASYAQLLRANQPVERSYFRPDSISYKGPAFFDGTKYQKLVITKADTRLDQSVSNGWLAAMQNHFVSAIVPHSGEPYHYLLRTQGNEFLLSATGPTQQVAAGSSFTQEESLYVGPKLQAQLQQTSAKLPLVADFGALTLVSQPLFKMLEWLHSFTGNWGVAIILATLALKLLFYPLSEASGRSMAKMKTLAPRIKNLQETYKDEREKLAKATMELYRKEKVNPAAGCLPMLIQIPVFLAFYWVLLESVELRQAPFVGWITDLSSRDPWFILPVIMAGANFIQFKLNPQMGTDPVQQKIFMLMPLIMSVTFAFFPAGLVLYWVTNTVLTIAQQWNINRRIAALTAKARS
jgi:YidC/Oxa1 family membrane protein insertase